MVDRQRNITHFVNNDDSMLEDGPTEEFRGATLQIQQDSCRLTPSPSNDHSDNESVAKLPLTPDSISADQLVLRTECDIQDDFSSELTLKPVVSSGTDAVSPVNFFPRKSIPKSSKQKFQPVRNDCLWQLQNPIPPSTEEEAREFFTYRDTLVQDAVKECAKNLILENVDGELLGSWLLTEISLWDNEKERLILLTSNTLTTVKYDFIALKQLEYRKISLHKIDTLVIGDLIYPSGSLVPRINGLASGVVTVVKGCLLKPLQERWTRNQEAGAKIDASEFYSATFDYMSFEPRSRNVQGVRAMWNKGEPLSFTKKWNPFNNEVPWVTYTSHPLLWHKGGENNKVFDVADFSQQFIAAIEKSQSQSDSLISCRIEHKPIMLQNYIGIGSLIHNRNGLGFFKVRGKFSF